MWGFPDPGYPALEQRGPSWSMNHLSSPLVKQHHTLGDETSVAWGAARVLITTRDQCNAISMGLGKARAKS